MNETNQTITVNDMKAILGIDIGTTSISAVIIDIEHNTVLETNTVANDFKLPTDSDLSEYDAQWILEKSKQIIDYFIEVYPDIVSIGLTGQMHGVVYVDEAGEAVSPLYNWQDGRGNRLISQDRTYCDEMKLRTGYTVFAGYGFATLFYNKMNHLEPENTNSFCTIMDYIAMKLADKSTPVIHPSNAASLGLYDMEKNCFDGTAIEKLGLEGLILPKIAKADERVGYYKNIPVSIAIGDNQASFYGSVKKENVSALVNFGTGSQISVVADSLKHVGENLEIRPYLFGKYLVCGSALCGGKAYAILEKFFSEYANQVIKATYSLYEKIDGLNEGSGCELSADLSRNSNMQTDSQYEIMNTLAREAYLQKQSLKVSTKFCGTRKEPGLRGSISEIGENNFTPGNLIIGVLQGMVDELKTYYDDMNISHITELVASGNAVQKNPVLKMLLQDTFHVKVNLTNGQEEAATGAALYAGVSSGAISAKQVTEIITYREE